MIFELIKKLEIPDHKETIKAIDDLGCFHLKDFLKVCEIVDDRKKLFISKKWPLNVFISSEIYNNYFFVYEPKPGFPESYLLLFETILNSEMVKFYFEMKYSMKKDDTPLHIAFFNKLPVPDLEEGLGTKDLVEKFVKSVDLGTPYHEKVLHDKEFVYNLYELIYYYRKKIEHYYLEKDRKVTEKDMEKYCEKMVDSLSREAKEGLVINSEWAISDFGVVVRFLGEKNKKPFQYNKDLEQFGEIFEYHTKLKRETILKEKKIRFYGNNSIIICKPNILKNWTKFIAIEDFREEFYLSIKRGMDIERKNKRNI